MMTRLSVVAGSGDALLEVSIKPEDGVQPETAESVWVPAMRSASLGSSPMA